MGKNKILIIDYGVGNHQSVANAIEFLGYDFLVSNKQADIVDAQSYILPGVGSFGEAMDNLHRSGIINILQEQVLKKNKPILGICLGMQVLADSSEEGGFHKGLGWIDGRIVRFEEKENFKIPHIGWNSISVVKKEPLLKYTETGDNFYFDHSYRFMCDDRFVGATSWYSEDIVVEIQKNNIFGVQFHPEKSQDSGLKLLRCFLDYAKNI